MATAWRWAFCNRTAMLLVNLKTMPHIYGNKMKDGCGLTGVKVIDEENGCFCAWIWHVIIVDSDFFDA